MRKNKIIIAITLLLFINLFIFNDYVYAFPGSYNSITQQGSKHKFSKNQGGWSAYTKKANDGTVVICTQYDGTTPASGKKTCSLNDSWTTGVRAGVASIIRNAGISNSMVNATASYVSAEMTINDFLADNGYSGKQINDRGINSTWKSAAQSKKNEIDTIIGNISVSIGSVSSTQDSDAFYISIPVSSNYGSVSITGVTNGSRMNDGRYKILKSSLSEGDNNITISARTSYGDYVARNYTCGSGYQTITPNYTEYIEVAANTTSKSITLTKVSKGKIKIEKRNSINNNLIQAVAKFDLYSGSNCQGNPIKTNISTSSGAVTIDDLTAGVYSIKEVDVPDGYLELGSNNTCVSTSVTVNPSQTTTVTIKNVPNCQTERDSFGNIPTISQLLGLYKKYPSNTNLLNFNIVNGRMQASCEVANCNSSNIQTTDCLAANIGNNSFNSNNLSCYDNSKQDIYGNYIGFCKNKLELTNNLGTNNFYSKSGQFLIKYNNGIHYIYNENLDLIPVTTSSLASASVTHTCFVLKENTIVIDPTNDVPSVNIYFGFDNEELITNKNTNPVISQSANTNFNMYVHKDNYSFNLNSIYLKRLTGKIMENKSNSTTDEIYGLISSFNESSGKIPFKLKYGSNEYNLDEKCTYNTQQEIIKYQQTATGKLDLEFRAIDKDEPFDRNTKSNWCDPNIENPVESCRKDNNRVESIISNRNDSYNSTGAGALYTNQLGTKKIILTPEIIQNIRTWNDSHEYDEYTGYCDDDGNCSTEFLDYIEIKKVS